MFQYRKSSAPVWLCFPNALVTGRQVCVTRTPTQPLSSPLHLAFLVSTSWGLLSSLPPAASSTFLSGTFYLCPPDEKKNENKDREDQCWCEVEMQMMERRVPDIGWRPQRCFLLMKDTFSQPSQTIPQGLSELEYSPRKQFPCQAWLLSAFSSLAARSNIHTTVWRSRTNGVWYPTSWHTLGPRTLSGHPALPGSTLSFHWEWQSL